MSSDKITTSRKADHLFVCLIIFLIFFELILPALYVLDGRPTYLEGFCWSRTKSSFLQGKSFPNSSQREQITPGAIVII